VQIISSVFHCMCFFPILLMTHPVYCAPSVLLVLISLTCSVDTAERSNKGRT
jgi:hypothetical protein